VSAVDDQVRAGDLTGMVHEVAGDQRLLAARGDPYADMAGGIAQGRDEVDLVAQPVIGLDEIGKISIPNRRHRVGEHRSHVIALTLPRPMRELDAAHQIARIWEGRDPASVDQHRVPSDMVDMEMGANHGVDRLARIAGGGEICQKAAVELVPIRDSPVLLVVTETGVHEDPPARRFGNERVNAHLEAPVLIDEIWPQPIDRQDRLWCRLGEDETAAARDFQVRRFW